MHKDFRMMPGPREARLLIDPNLSLSSPRNSLFFLLLYFQAVANIHSTQLICPCSPEKTSKKERWSSSEMAARPTPLRHPCHPDLAPRSGPNHVLSSQASCSFLPPNLCTSSSASQNAFLQQFLWEATSPSFQMQPFPAFPDGSWPRRYQCFASQYLNQRKAQSGLYSFALVNTAAHLSFFIHLYSTKVYRLSSTGQTLPVCTACPPGVRLL